MHVAEEEAPDAGLYVPEGHGVHGSVKSNEVLYVPPGHGTQLAAGPHWGSIMPVIPRKGQVNCSHPCSGVCWM